MSDAPIRPKRERPIIAGLLIAVGIVCFIGSAISLFGTLIEIGSWWLFGAAAALFVAGAFCCAIGEIIVYLATLLARIESSNDHQNETNKALQWIVDNWSSRQ